MENLLHGLNEVKKNAYNQANLAFSMGDISRQKKIYHLVDAIQVAIDEAMELDIDISPAQNWDILAQPIEKQEF